jgi:hypothetical protein
MTLVAVVNRKREHRAKYSIPAHAYYLACSTASAAAHHLDMIGQRDRTMHVMCEARGAKEDAALKLKSRESAWPSQWTRGLPFEIVLASKQINPECLQLRILTARRIRLQVLRPDQLDYARGEAVSWPPCSDDLGNGFQVFPGALQIFGIWQAFTWAGPVVAREFSST